MHECMCVSMDCVWYNSVCDNKQMPIKATHDIELINYFEWRYSGGGEGEREGKERGKVGI